MRCDVLVTVERVVFFVFFLVFAVAAHSAHKHFMVKVVLN